MSTVLSTTSPCCILIILLVTSLLGIGSTRILSNKDESQLLRHLMHGYRYRVRPICDENFSPTSVNVSSALRQILELDDVNQVLKTNVWMLLSWYDCRLSWNESRFNNISDIVLPMRYLWKPDVNVHESIGVHYVRHMSMFLARIRHDGRVDVFVPSGLTTVCKLDISDFPFDRQTCRIKFGSMVEDRTQIRLIKNDEPREELLYYKPNSEWSLLSYTTENLNFSDPCCPGDFTERRPLYYLFNLGLPVLLELALVSISFLLPFESGEKITLGITIMLSLSVFLLVVSKMTPTTSETLPLIGVCFGVIMVLVCLNCMSTVLVLNVFHHGGHDKIPAWLEKLIGDYLSQIVQTHDTYLFLRKEIRLIQCYSSLPRKMRNLKAVGTRLATPIVNVNYRDAFIQAPMITGSSPSQPPFSPSTSSANVPRRRSFVVLDKESSPFLEMQKRDSVDSYIGGDESPQDSLDTINESAADRDEQILRELNRQMWKNIAKTLDRFFGMCCFLGFVALILFIATTVLKEDAESH